MMEQEVMDYSRRLWITAGSVILPLMGVMCRDQFGHFKKLTSQDSKQLTWTNVKTQKITDDVLVVSISPNGKYIIVTLLDCIVQLNDTQYKDDTWSNCAMTGYAVNLVKGDALLVFNLHPNATPDESSIRGGCKVLEGEKWIATKRIHARAYNLSKSPPSDSDDECSDEDNNCANLAVTGECQRNPVYMLGTPDYCGACRKSCGACWQFFTESRLRCRVV